MYRTSMKKVEPARRPLQSVVPYVFWSLLLLLILLNVVSVITLNPVLISVLTVVDSILLVCYLVGAMILLFGGR